MTKQRAEELSTVVAAFAREQQVETARNLLAACGIDADRVTLVVRPSKGLTGVGPATERFSRVGPAAATGAMLGSYLGVAMGPFWPAGTVAGGLIGWLIGLGLPRAEAEDFGERLLDGQPVLVVRISPDRADDVRRALRQAEAQPAELDAAELERLLSTLAEPLPLAARVAAPTPYARQLEPASPRPRADAAVGMPPLSQEAVYGYEWPAGNPPPAGTDS